MVSSNAISEWSSNPLSGIFYTFPYVECFFFLILVMITIKRKRLSSNDEYRDGQHRTPKKRTTLLEKLYMKYLHERVEYFRKYIDFVLWVINPVIISVQTNDINLEEEKVKKTVDINKLSDELVFHIADYLETHEIVQLSSTSKGMKELMMRETFWENLWMKTYGHHWHCEPIKSIRERRNIFWDPFLMKSPPECGWFRFFIHFESHWLDWILAGYNSNDLCYVAVDNEIFDVTHFLPNHPGSLETLTEKAGCDASEEYKDIGHSTLAEDMKKNFLVWNPNCFSENNGKFSKSEIRRAIPSKVLHKKAKFIQKEIARISTLYWTSIRSRNQNAVGSIILPDDDTESEGGALTTLLNTISINNLNNKINHHPFRPVQKCVEGLEGYYYQCNLELHKSEAKAFYDPLNGEWSCWWSCCGKSYEIIPNSPLDLKHLMRPKRNDK